MKDSQLIIIGVTGGSGSGKISINRAILSNFPDHSIMMLEQDFCYKDQSHLSFEERLDTNYDRPFAFDTDLLIQHVEQLLNYQVIEEPVYDYVAHTRSIETMIQGPKEVIILEGILISEGCRSRGLMDTKAYMGTDDDIRTICRIRRGMGEHGHTSGSVTEQYLTVVKPMCRQFIEPTKCYAGIIAPEGGENHVAIDLINARMDSISARM